MLNWRAMNRREFLYSVACSVSGAAQPKTVPNVVLIYADDLGSGDLGCYGHPTIRTPNLDRMAAEGCRFTQFYSAAPLCSPSRAALLTGRYPVRSGINFVLFPDSEGGLPDSEVTIAEMLKQRGYATAIVGKWHLGHLPKYLPTRHGFDSYFGISYSNDMSFKTNPVYDEINREVGRQRRPANLERYRTLPGIPLMRDEKVIETEPDQSQLTPRYTAEANRFVRTAAAGRKPFFLYFAHTFPHVPLAASERFRGRSRRGLYGDAVEELDWSVGEVIRTLAELGLKRTRWCCSVLITAERSRLGATAAQTEHCATGRGPRGRAGCESRSLRGGKARSHPDRFGRKWRPRSTSCRRLRL
jgi:arylsulfatase A-like enzyme